MKMTEEEPEELKIEVPWGELAMKCWNSPEFEPCLVAHGLCENAGAFDRLIPRLPKNFYYVVVDLPGHGYSTSFACGLTLDFMNYVSVLQRIVNYFRWKKVNMMGHSFGAHLMEFYAATYTGKVEKLILLDAVVPSPVDGELFLVFYRNQWRQLFGTEKKNLKPTAYTYEKALSQVADRRMSNLSPEAAKPLLDRSVRLTDEGYVFTTDPRARFEIRPGLSEQVLLYHIRRIKCPVLLILAQNGGQFPIFTSSGFYADILDALKKTNNYSKVIQVPGNHCVHNNQPEIIAPIISRFLIFQQSKM